jgi:ABC-type nitrate/sulfonate/bicarbonate transport system permease component
MEQPVKIGLTRAFLIPVLALLFALLLIYTRSSTEDQGSTTWIRFPEALGGEQLRLGLRTIAVLFGLSCFPGALIGAALGWLLVQNSKLASASISLLRIGQWTPFAISWALVELLVIAPGQQPGRYFIVWTMSIPAVALGSCYHFLSLRHLLRLEWRTCVTETARLAIMRAFFITLLMLLSVWLGHWAVYPGNTNVMRHYVAASVMALFLLIVSSTYRSGIEHSAELHREIILADLNHRNDGSTRTAAFVVLLFVVIWHLLNLIGNYSVSPVRVFNAAVTLFSEAAIWRDMRISLLEIFAGLVFSVVIALIVSAALLTHVRLRTCLLPILSFTFVIPILVLPAGQGWLMYRGLFRWTATCVACLFMTTTGVVVLSFFPMMQTFWAFREKPILCRILFATEQALPYGFTAMLYGEMMSATAGLGFTVVGATATNQTEKAFAGFVITLSLLLGLSSTLRLLARWGYYSSDSSKENHIHIP